LKKSKLIIPPGINIRAYQVEAYSNWCAHDYSGIFAMATGTGKTITAINCVYSEHLLNFEKNGKNCYYLVILVPSQPLLEQWAQEVSRWGLTSQYLISGEYNWKAGIQELINDYQFGISSDFVIIATYRSLIRPEFLQLLNKLPEDTILIADEAHSLGQKQTKAVIPFIKGLKKRIGLSATPKRNYDEEGTADMENFFWDKAPYVFSLFMDKAIEAGFLCKYEYYPVLVELTPSEMEEYIQISKKLAMLLISNPDGEGLSSGSEFLLLKRKRIISKAVNKISALAEIIKCIQEREELKYCFTYAPAGEIADNDLDIEQDNIRMIRKMQRVFNQQSPKTKTHAYLGETENRQEILESFEKGDIDVLLAINCLDEGIDIPRTSIGIFTSSTGNPRQFIQRRGRLLRNHIHKSRALIYDMVVIPKIFSEEYNKTYFKIEKKLVQSELMRVGYFAKLSENFYDAKEALENVCQYYNLDLNTVIKELEE